MMASDQVPSFRNLRIVRIEVIVYFLGAVMVFPVVNIV